MTPEKAVSPAKETHLEESADFLLWWLSPALVLVAGFFVWLNHFRSGFHFDDLHHIVNNRAITGDASIWRLLTDPRAFSSLREYADYRPLLSLSFLFDYWIGGNETASFFQLDTFFWFIALLFVLYLLIGTIPRMDHRAAVLATAMFGFHPLVADTVNYVSQRGAIIGAIGLCLGLFLWIMWPLRVPKRIPFDMNRVPTSWVDQMIWEHGAWVNRKYAEIKTWPLGLHLYPVFIAMLFEPSVAAFPLIALAYSKLFVPETKWRRYLAPSAVCGGYWLFHAILQWQYSGAFRQPATSYWMTQPLAVVRGLYLFVLPANLALDTGLDGNFGTITVILGFVGLLVIIAVALVAGRVEEWKPVSFGLWWYLSASVPFMLEPRMTLESTWRLFVPAIGAAIAFSGAIWVVWSNLPAFPWARVRLISMVGWSFFMVVIVAGFGWNTYTRSSIWGSDIDLWQGAADANPRSSRAAVQAALSSQADGDDTTAVEYFERARIMVANDPITEYQLGIGLDRLGYDNESEGHMKRAIAMIPKHALGYAQYARWLMNHRRVAEALTTAKTASSLGPEDVLSRQVLMEIYSEQYDWPLVQNAAEEVLRSEPDEPIAQRFLAVARYGEAQLERADGRSKETATPDDFLNLSVVLYHHKRYDECIQAARSALKIRADLPEAYANIATAYHTMGRIDEAIDATRELLRLRPNLYFAMSDLQVLLREKAVAEGKIKPQKAQ